ncbi:MAG: hypothetical protein ACFFE2_06550 [Candidatus Thorarchaeota archaeon]
MNKTKAVSAFVIALFIGSSVVVGLGMQSVHALNSQNQNVIASADGSDNNHLPKSMLVYTEFADQTRELPNTLDVVRANFLNDYQITNLTSYDHLSSMIMNYDVFLIPEQELLSDENITTIATAWSGILDSFVTNGGNVIVMPCYGPLASDPHAPMIQVLNMTGFITYTEAYAYPGSPLNVVDADDALARGIPLTFAATDGTTRINGTGGTTVVDDGVGPVVIHMTMGMGHIAILGFDLWNTAPAQEAILVNAIQLTRLVVFDQSHAAYGSINAAHLNYSLDLVSQGFAVSAMSTWDPAMIQMADVLILTTGTMTYSSAETDVIEDFVASGGGLIVYTDWGTYGDELDPVTERFGFVRNKTGYVQDLNDTLLSYTPYDAENFGVHSIMVGVFSVELDRGGSLVDYPNNGIALITTDDDGTAFYDDNSPADGVVVAAAAGVGLGRVAVVTDRNFLSIQTDPDSDGTYTYYDADNEEFLLNSVLWASGAGAEEKFIVFDESHGRNWWLTLSYFGFGQFLTENGYTIRWIDNWTTDASLLDKADAIIIQDGDTNYTASEIAEIVDYVSEGGGLALLGGQTIYGLQADMVGNEFGLDLNNSGYITDTDDYLDASHQNIGYDQSNFGIHPIMNGVERLELQWTSAFISIGAGISLVRTDSDGTATWDDGTPADGLTLMTALEYNMGRVFFSADYIFPRYNFDYDLDGIPILYDSDNDVLLQNVFRWLTENRAPSVEVSAPNGGEVLSGLVLVNWTAVDFDSDPLTFDVYYSDNAGSDWNLLQSGVTGLQYEWNTTLLDDGTGYMIRVEVSDGIHATMDDSDATFELDNRLGPQPPGPLDPLLLVIIAGGVVVVIIIVIVFSKKGRGK